jgi:hypothetical protein
VPGPLGVGQHTIAIPNQGRHLTTRPALPNVVASVTSSRYPDIQQTRRRRRLADPTCSLLLHASAGSPVRTACTAPWDVEMFTTFACAATQRGVAKLVIGRSSPLPPPWACRHRFGSNEICDPIREDGLGSTCTRHAHCRSTARIDSILRIEIEKRPAGNLEGLSCSDLIKSRSSAR